MLCIRKLKGIKRNHKKILSALFLIRKMLLTGKSRSPSWPISSFFFLLKVIFENWCITFNWHVWKLPKICIQMYLDRTKTGRKAHCAKTLTSKSNFHSATKINDNFYAIQMIKFLKMSSTVNSWQNLKIFAQRFNFKE